jgi:hypothetical protein
MGTPKSQSKIPRPILSPFLQSYEMDAVAPKSLRNSAAMQWVGGIAATIEAL